MSRSQRHKKILGVLESEGDLSVSAMAASLGVSPMTIRRDLAALESKGALIRTHGGAVAARRGMVEFRFAERHLSCLAAKRGIARVAVSYIKPNDCVLLDTGTTALEVAHAMRFLDGVRIVTTSLAVAAALYSQRNLELVLLGGTVRHVSPDLSGPLTEENLSSFRLDVAFLGADGAGPDGLYTESVAGGRLSRCMFACAERVIIVADHTTFTHGAFHRYARWDDVDLVISDENMPRDVRDWLEDVVTVEYATVE